MEELIKLGARTFDACLEMTQLDWNLRYLPRNDSGNDSKLERRVMDKAEVRSRRHDHCWCLEIMLVLP
jgi:hypothetical protein